MTLVVLPDPPSDGQTADASDVNDQDNAIVAVVNGNLDDSNISSLSGTKIVTGTIPETAYSAAAKQGWYNISTLPSAVTYNGNRSYDVTFGADLTTVLSSGMRMRYARSVAAPTQCTSLNGTTQYYSKASPAGMTFTDDFVVSAWVKLVSYSSSDMTIMSRFNGTSGWVFQAAGSSGQVVLAAFNAGGSNLSKVTSYQSIPFNKWVHLTAQLDMSSFTTTNTTSYIMIDGVDVPCVVARAGTNPTALIQAGNLEVGDYNAGNGFFPGKIAQAFITSAKLTQTQVRAVYSQGLTSADMTTYSIISAYSFNNSINDINTTSANNLTASGSAVATTTDSPFSQSNTGVPGGTYDHAVVTNVGAFSGGNTIVTVQVPEGCTIPTSGGITAVVYSGLKAPFGFISDRSKWRLSSLLTYAPTTTANVTYGAFLGGGWRLTIPVGSWDNVGWTAQVYNTTTTPVYFNLSSTPLTGLGNNVAQLTSRYAAIAYAPTGSITTNVYISEPQRITSTATYVMYTYGNTAGAGLDNSTVQEIFADFGQL